MDVEDSVKKFDFESSNSQGPGKNGTPLDTERVNVCGIFQKKPSFWP